MFEKKKKREDNLESVFNALDRGPVSSFIKDNQGWIECCARCHTTVHILIMLDDGKREKACPKCLVITKDRGNDGGNTPKVVTPLGNRIKRYLK
jgi:hypothetical protein